MSSRPSTASAKRNLPSSDKGRSAFIEADTGPSGNAEKIDAALMTLARMFARQAADAYVRVGIPIETTNLEQPQNA